MKYKHLPCYLMNFALSLPRVVAGDRPRGMFWPSIVTQTTIGSGMTAEGQHAYAHHKQHQVARGRNV
jgi:hypothetical protein